MLKTRHINNHLVSFLLFFTYLWWFKWWVILTKGMLPLLCVLICNVNGRFLSHRVITPSLYLYSELRSEVFEFTEDFCAFKKEIIWGSCECNWECLSVTMSNRSGSNPTWRCHGYVAYCNSPGQLRWCNVKQWKAYIQAYSDTDLDQSWATQTYVAVKLWSEYITSCHINIFVISVKCELSQHRHV